MRRGTKVSSMASAVRDVAEVLETLLDAAEPSTLTVGGRMVVKRLDEIANAADDKAAP